MGSPITSWEFSKAFTGILFYTKGQVKDTQNEKNGLRFLTQHLPNGGNQGRIRFGLNKVKIRLVFVFIFIF
jgi:hypothetical protein